MPPEAPGVSEDFRHSLKCGKYRKAYTRAIIDTSLRGDRPRYIVPDLARKKGVFVMPDGSCRFDEDMRMFLYHQFLVRTKSAVVGCDEWFMRKSGSRELKTTLASEAHTGAKRLCNSQHNNGAQ